MTEKRFTVHIKWFNCDKTEGEITLKDNGQPLLESEFIEDVQRVKVLFNELNDENKKLKQDLKDCKKLAGKRLNKIRNHRAVIEDLGGSIRAYKGQISQLNEKIEKIQEAMEDTGALTKRQLEEILND